MGIKRNGDMPSAHGPAEQIRPGDTLWFAPGGKHRHGTARQVSMTHMAIAETPDGRTVEWMERICDADHAAYRRPEVRS